MKEIIPIVLLVGGLLAVAPHENKSSIEPSVNPLLDWPGPKAKVQFFTFEQQKNLTDQSWPHVMEDIENHLPASYGTQYRSNDLVTWSHETTHGINSHLRMHYGKVGQNAFYVLNDKAIILSEPKYTRITDIAPAIPQELRGMRYNLYLIDQARQWNNSPLYIFDEWIAYTNGTACALELAKQGKSQRKSDDLISILEFDVYSLYVLHVSKSNDPQLKAFYAWNLKRTLNLYKEGHTIESLNWDNDDYYNRVLSHAGVKEILVGLYGETWVKSLGFK